MDGLTIVNTSSDSRRTTLKTRILLRFSSFSIIPLLPELPVTRALRVTNNNKVIFVDPDIRDAGVRMRLFNFICLEGRYSIALDQ